MMSRLPKAAVFLLLVALMPGCSDTFWTGPKTGALQVYLTDAPADYLASAHVTISHVYLVSDEDTTAAPDTTVADSSQGRVDIYGPDAEPLTFNLMELRNGIEALLAESDVETGMYHQLRMVVDTARVELAEGYVFQDGATTAGLKVPSGGSNGIKVGLSEPLDINEDRRTVVVVDVDVNKNFRILGNPEDPDGIKGIVFTPLLSEIRRETVELE